MIKKIIKDFFVYGISFGINNLLGIILIPLYTSLFSPSEFGILDLIVTLVSLVSILAMMQLESSVARFFHQLTSEAERTQLVSNAFISVITVSVLLVVCVVLLSPKISFYLFNTSSLSNVVVIAALKIPLINTISLFQIVLRYQKRAKVYGIISSLQTLIVMGLILLFVVHLKHGIRGVFEGELIGYFIIAVILTLLLRDKLKLRITRPLMNQMFRYSLPLLPAVAGSWANSSMNRQIMLSHLSLSEIGIYSLALKISSTMLIFYNVVKLVWEPYFWETLEKPNHKEIFKKVQLIASVTTFSLIILMTLSAKFLITIFANDKYFDSIQLVGVVAFAIGIRDIIVRFTGIGPSITHKTEYNTIIYLIGTAVNIVLLVISIKHWGLISVPICLLIGNTVLLIISWINSEKLYPIGFNYKIFTAGYLLCAVTVGLKYYFDTH